MRKSGVALGLAVAMCAFGVATAPALAFGKFYASIKGRTVSEAEPGIATGHGQATALRIGPYKLECDRVRNKGKVISEGPSESFFTEVTFLGCYTRGSSVLGLIHFTLAMEFLSKFSAKAGEGESEVRITEPSEVLVTQCGAGGCGIEGSPSEASFETSDSECVVVIPEQSLRLTQEAGAGYEAALPETEEELLEKPRQIEKYGQVRKRLAFTIDVKKLKTEIKPSRKCRLEGEEGKFNPETGYVEFRGGIFEGGLQEVTLKRGNLWFEEE
jgi:hypothetical protein